MHKTLATISLILTLTFTGCVHVKTVSLTSVPEDRGQAVSAEGSRFLFLGISFSTDYVDEAIAKLSDQCPNGKIEGVLTKLEVVNYFLFFFATERVVAKGFCR